MILRRVPSSILFALGLTACGDDNGSDEGGSVGPCLICDPQQCNETVDATDDDTGTASATGSTSSATDSGSTGVDESDVGPCLTPEQDSSSGGSSSGSSSGSESGSESGDGASSTTASGLDDAPAAGARAWADAFARVSERLPADVAARLGKDNGGGQ